MRKLAAIIFDFDGVLLESEFEANVEIAALLTELGHAHTPAEAIRHYTGLNGRDFIHAIERRIGGPVPDAFHSRMKEKAVVALEQGIEAVAGAVEFVRDLPPEMAKAVASSSSSSWIRGHIQHLGLAGAFGDHLYSGREHVTRGKPAPDIYLHAARQLGIAIEDCVIIEDSSVGARGAVASGARVIGLAAGRHCFDGHEELLRSAGVSEIAHSFDEVRRLLGLA